jgi:L-alanine-DL-glutamate epimerase-like enolase superfamily enzyme
MANNPQLDLHRTKIKITNVKLTVFIWPDLPSVSYTRQATKGGEGRLGLVTISTDAGIDGHAFLGSSFRSAELDARAMIDILKPLLIGENALDRDRLHRVLMIRHRAVMLRAIGAIDVALWDIAGKIANLPIYQMIGPARHKVPVYASSSTLNTVQGYVDQALEVKAEGYRGYKMHPPHDKALHVPMLEKVREAVGDDYPLMYDPAMCYNYTEAVRIGRVIEKLDYLWFEDPLPIDDMYNYQKLCADLDVPVMATEYSHGGFPGYSQWIAMKATDALRGDVAVKGGLTPCLKGAHLAEAFHMNFEIHHGGNSLNNVANLHLALAIPNCSYIEVLLPHAAHKYGILNEMELDSEGCYSATDRPGLGAEIDFDRIEKRKVQVFE